MILNFFLAFSRMLAGVSAYRYYMRKTFPIYFFYLGFSIALEFQIVLARLQTLALKKIHHGIQSKFYISINSVKLLLEN